MMNKQKILFISAILVSTLVMANTLIKSSENKLYAFNMYEGSVNSSFNYLKPLSTSSSKRSLKKYDYDSETPANADDFIKMNKPGSASSINETVSSAKNSASKISRQQDDKANTGGVAAAGIYFSKGKSKSDLAVDVKSPASLSVNLQDNGLVAMANPQMASNASTDGGDPGGDPMGGPLPLKDDLLVLSLLASIYVMFIVIKKSRK